MIYLVPIFLIFVFFVDDFYIKWPLHGMLNVVECSYAQKAVMYLSEKMCGLIKHHSGMVSGVLVLSAVNSI